MARAGAGSTSLLIRRPFVRSRRELLRHGQELRAWGEVRRLPSDLCPGEGRLALGRDALEVLAYGRDLLAQVAGPEQSSERGEVGLAALRGDLGLGLGCVALRVGLVDLRVGLCSVVGRVVGLLLGRGRVLLGLVGLLLRVREILLGGGDILLRRTELPRQPGDQRPGRDQRSGSALALLLLGGRGLGRGLRGVVELLRGGVELLLSTPSACVVSSFWLVLASSCLALSASPCALSRSDRSVSAQINRATATSPSPALTQTHGLRCSFRTSPGGADAASGCGPTVDMTRAETHGATIRTHHLDRVNRSATLPGQSQCAAGLLPAHAAQPPTPGATA